MKKTLIIVITILMAALAGMSVFWLMVEKARREEEERYVSGVSTVIDKIEDRRDGLLAALGFSSSSTTTDLGVVFLEQIDEDILALEEITSYYDELKELGFCEKNDCSELEKRIAIFREIANDFLVVREIYSGEELTCCGGKTEELCEAVLELRSLKDGFIAKYSEQRDLAEAEKLELLVEMGKIEEKAEDLEREFGDLVIFESEKEEILAFFDILERMKPASTSL